MRRKIAFVLSLAALVTTLAAPPAHADYGGGIVYCTGDIPTGACWGVKGIAMSTWIHSPSLGCRNPAAQHVESIYVVRSFNNGVPWNFIEFGWSQNRNLVCLHSPRHLFIRGRHNGTYDLVWDGPGLPNGNYLLRLKLFQRTDGKFVFQYSYNSDGSNAQDVRYSNGNLIIYDPTTRGWSPNNGLGLTAMEVNSSTDSCGVYARNIWIQNGLYAWRAANAPNNAEMVYLDNGTAQCGSVRLGGSGGLGDDIEYYKI